MTQYTRVCTTLDFWYCQGCVLNEEPLGSAFALFKRFLDTIRREIPGPDGFGIDRENRGTAIETRFGRGGTARGPS